MIESTFLFSTDSAERGYKEAGEAKQGEEKGKVKFVVGTAYRTCTADEKHMIQSYALWWLPNQAVGR